VIEAQRFGSGTCSSVCKRQRRGATNVAGVSTSSGAGQPEILRTRAKGRRCRLRASEFFCRYSVSVSAAAAPNNLQASPMLATKRGGLSTG